MWKLEVLDWDGVRLGEITNAKNITLNFGLSKNSNLAFETPLESDIGQVIANEQYLLISAYQKNKSTGNFDLRFIGPVINKEEIGNNSLPTIGITAVGAYWRLSKRIVNNDKNEGREERGAPISPQPLRRIIACDTGNNRLVYFNERTGNWIENKGGTASGTGDNQFNAPRGVAVNPENQNYYVLDSGNQRVQQYDADDNFVRRFGSGTIGATARGIAIDADGNVWVGDRANKRLLKYSATGTLLTTVTGTTDYRLESIYDVVSYDDRVIAVDIDTTYDHGCQAFDLSGTFLEKAENDSDRIYRSCAPSSILNTTEDDVFGNRWLMYFSNDALLTFVAEFVPYDAIDTPAILDGAFGYDPHHCATIPIAENLDTAYIAFSNSGGTGIFSGIYSYEFNVPPVPYDNGNIPQFIKPVRQFGGDVGTGNGETKDLEYFDIWEEPGKSGVDAVSEIIENTNTLAGNSWIVPADPQGTSSDIVIDYNTFGGFKKINEAIDDLSGNLEWKIIPVLENAGDQDTLVLGEWYGNEIIGSNKSSTVNFEYGTARLNVKQYAIRENLEGFANRISYPTAGYVPYNVSKDDESSVADIGAFEDILTGSVLLPEIRQSLASSALQLRGAPRIMVEITPFRSDAQNWTVPIPLIDYEPGDIVGVLIYDNNLERINGEVRIYDIEINVDNSGKEEATLKLYVEEA